MIECARFNNDPKLCHENALKRICKYVLGTMNKGSIFKQYILQGLECFVDTDFARGWDSGNQRYPVSVFSLQDLSLCMQDIQFIGKVNSKLKLCKVQWKLNILLVSLNLQGTSIPYFVQKNHDVIPLQESKLKFFCQVWEDNHSCIKVAESPKFIHRMKHISLKYHHFW